MFSKEAKIKPLFPTKDGLANLIECFITCFIATSMGVCVDTACFIDINKRLDSNMTIKQRED